MFKILWRTIFTILLMVGLLYNAIAQDEDKVRSNRTESREELSAIIGDGGVYHKYVDPERLFRLNLPRGWKVDEDPGEGINVKFISPDNPDIEISIKVTKAKEVLKEVKEGLKNNKKCLENYQLLSDEEYVIDGEKGCMFCSSFSQPLELKPETKCSEVIFIKGDRLIYFKYIAPLDDYDKYFPIFRGRLMTFENL